MSWIAIFTAIGEAFKFLNENVFTAKRRAKNLEDQKQDAFRKAKELAHGEDEKALKDHIEKLPG